MIADVHAKCRVCGRDIATKTADIAPREAHKCATGWKRLLACNRCCDFKFGEFSRFGILKNPGYDSILQSMNKVCYSMTQGSGDLSDLTTALEHWARIFAGLLERHYFLSGLFQPDFITLLIDEPHKCSRILAGFHANARKISKTKQDFA